MQAPLFVRPLTVEERSTLEAVLRSPSAFTVRRCQFLLASAEGQHTTTIARIFRCTDQTVRNAIHAFNQRGVDGLHPLPSRPDTIVGVFDERRREQLRALLHQSPRAFGKETSIWTLALAAEVSFAQGITPRLVSDETIRTALRQLGVSWKRAKHWITSPDPDYARKKRARPADPLGRGPPDLGPRLWRRGLVEPPGPPRPASLAGGRYDHAAPSTGVSQG